MTQNVHIVPHMHWDREWYFTTEESRILLINNMEEILTRLETDENYPYFVLDGQTVVLEDYFAVKPENKERVKKLVQQGKLIIGPWYTQTDEMVVGGESIVRNLLYGLKDSAEFGNPMKIGYLPDSFGQSEQMPHIYNGFGINRAIFWRGMTEYNGTKNSEFTWKSAGGDQVTTLLMPLGYAIGKYLPEEKEALKERMDKNFNELDGRATTPHVLIPNGHDQMPIQQNIFEVIEKLKELYPEKDFFLSNYDKLFDSIEEHQDSFEAVQGEFLEGKYMRVHKSIYSSRMDIKAKNAYLENRITNLLEPLASIAHVLGFEYHHGLIELIWKEMMKNHAHDSIGCCCSDKVHQEIMERFRLVEEKVDRLIDFYKRRIVDAVPNVPHQDKLAVFNLLPYMRNEVIESTLISKEKEFVLMDNQGTQVDYEIVHEEVIDPGLIDRQIVHYGNYDPFIKYQIQFKDEVPAFGYKTYKIERGEYSKAKALEKTTKLENEFYEITFNDNGTMNVFDKDLEKKFENLLLVEDGADEGDTYDFSPLKDDFIVTNEDVNADISCSKTSFTETAKISYNLTVPKNLESRKLQKRDGSVGVAFIITLKRGTKRIDIQAKYDNQAEDHRLRVLFPTGYSSDVSVSDHQFGSIQRKVVEPTMAVWEEEGWDERPDAINPMLSYVGLHNTEQGFALLSNSTREYEVIGNAFDTIALTQFRSVGVLGKADLLRRPNRPSGIALPTPDSQMKGEIKLDFAITTHEGDTISGKVPQRAKEYLTPMLTYNKIAHDAMRLNPVDFSTPSEFSLFEQNDDNTVLSVVKKSEKDEGLIVRLFNPSRTNELNSCLTFNAEVQKSEEVNLNEETIQNIDCIEGKYTIKHNHCSQKTYKFYIER
ncbi:mannosylglycerate hydrolase [Bacillus sp. NEB1478]|uniref:mannosylglycerate hydrolase n=1 Tax=Bacillus sp. NEB1478 TaxID=3073816 RepID=UPI002872E502|nr:mannosylglycerate hydrolase [Bacillus sp. NEB1478]WNB92652.1 mannosylglycerate hydrolase [Bacillus sp. NEB1478]